MAALHDLSQLPATLSLLSSPVVRGRARVRRPGRGEQGGGEGDSIALLESDREAGEGGGHKEGDRGDKHEDTSEQQDSDEKGGTTPPQPAPAAAPSPGRSGSRSGSEAGLLRRLAGGRDYRNKEVGSMQCFMEERDRRGRRRDDSKLYVQLDTSTLIYNLSGIVWRVR